MAHAKRDDQVKAMRRVARKERVDALREGRRQRAQRIESGKRYNRRRSERQWRSDAD